MRPEQWETFKRAVRREKMDKVPMALIIDSPWIPGYLGIKHLDYFLDPELWFQSNLKIMREFPDIIFIPSWWMEYGMAAEPSVLGAKIKFWQDNTPSEYADPAQAGGYRQLSRVRSRSRRVCRPDLAPHRDGPAAHSGCRLHPADGHLTRTALHRGICARHHRIHDRSGGRSQGRAQADRPVHARDHRLAQSAAESDGRRVESIFILDDIVGFINEEHYLEFAHPYLKRICDAFPKDWVKLYHNDAEVDACLDHLPDTGFNVLNWGKQRHITEVKRRVGDRMCLMGNVNPLEIAVRGTPEEVKDETLEVLEGSGGEGIILSVGGGVSPGMPRENILAMLEALDEFNAKRAVSAVSSAR